VDQDETYEENGGKTQNGSESASTETNDTTEQTDPDEAYENNSSGYQGKTTSAQEEPQQKQEEVDADEAYEENGGKAPTSSTSSGSKSYPPGAGYAMIYEKMSPNKPLTEEEKAEQLKRRKRDEVLSSIGDGLSAMHQAYTYARGIKPLTPPTSMSEKTRERYERYAKERDAMDSGYLQGYMRAMQMDQQQANAVERLQLQRDHYAQLERRWQEEQALKAKAQQDKDDNAKAETERKKKADEERNARRMESNRTSERRVNVQASRAAGGRSSSSTTSYYDRNGRETKRIVKEPGKHKPEQPTKTGSLLPGGNNAKTKGTMLP
jgi:hypothetical protein